MKLLLQKNILQISYVQINFCFALLLWQNKLKQLEVLFSFNSNNLILNQFNYLLT